jgi:hypothetical protein
VVLATPRGEDCSGDSITYQTRSGDLYWQWKMEGKPSITAISWTGGKDCNLALLFAKRDPALDVRYLVVFRISEKAFHAHPISLMTKQAKSLALKLLFVDFPEGTTDYFQAYVDGIRNLYDTYGTCTSGQWSGIGWRDVVKLQVSMYICLYGKLTVKML